MLESVLVKDCSSGYRLTRQVPPVQRAQHRNDVRTRGRPSDRRLQRCSRGHQRPAPRPSHRCDRRRVRQLQPRPSQCTADPDARRHVETGLSLGHSSPPSRLAQESVSGRGRPCTLHTRQLYRKASLAEARCRRRQGHPEDASPLGPSCFPPSPSRLGQPPLASFVGHPDAQACIKSAYVNGGEVFVTKVGGGQ